MHSTPQQNISDFDEQEVDSINHPTIVIATFLDECFDSNTPIPNKRRLHSSLSQLAQSRTLARSVVRDVEKCVAALKGVNESPLVVVETWQLDEMESMARTMAAQKEQLARQSELEREAEMLRADKQTFISVVDTLRRKQKKARQENELLRSDLETTTSTLETKERSLIQAKQLFDRMEAKLTARSQPIVASDFIVTFSPDCFKLSGSYVANVSGSWGSCFTKPVSTGIHRLSIRNFGTSEISIGVCDPAECPNHLASRLHGSPKAAMMHKQDGHLWSAGKRLVQNTAPQKFQEWSVEADLEERTVHFFVDRVQQPHHFTNIPVPLVFAIDTIDKDVPIEITFWGETQSHVTFEGTGHNLG
ncbi:hypothetical protein BLNAU_8742 [Blattamonas nauphoetae]|uniref:Uncharacterized protein n=1 Tax=Blattamonas nauphoetae TaxID=2049346 RepID=A0ABQ9XXJ1_9EUKA|nr:hypothetical protein BLNAU_8742 [Blattamonas nauphoetae]